MSLSDFLQKFLSAIRRRWADVIASDLAAGRDLEPELPASAFVRLEGKPPRLARQAGGTAVRQRSARISGSSG